MCVDWKDKPSEKAGTKQRRSERKPSQIRAFISDIQDLFEFKCVVSDISKHGCRIVTPEIDRIPDLVFIAPKGFDAPICGKIVWRKEKTGGVKLLSPSELNHLCEFLKPAKDEGNPDKPLRRGSYAERLAKQK